MSRSCLKEQIIGSYDELMQDYLESDTVKQEGIEWNKWYYSFREKLRPELRQEFDELVRADMEMAQAEAEEAFYRGVITGIAERDTIFPK